MNVPVFKLCFLVEQELSLCGVQLHDNALLVAAMSQLKSLTHVRLCGVPAFNDATMEPVRCTSFTCWITFLSFSFCLLFPWEPNLFGLLVQILKEVGEKLEMLDLSGGIMCSITDEGLKWVTKYCPNLKNLGETCLQMHDPYDFIREWIFSCRIKLHISGRN